MHTAAGAAHSILCSADVCACILVLWAEGDGSGWRLPLYVAWARTSLETHLEHPNQGSITVFPQILKSATGQLP